MAKKFAGFTPAQLGRIVPEMAGMQADEQKLFLAANPAAARRVGMMTDKLDAWLRYKGTTKVISLQLAVSKPIFSDVYYLPLKSVKQNVVPESVLNVWLHDKQQHLSILLYHLQQRLLLSRNK